MDFALITLKTPVTEGTGYFGIQRGTGDANIDISSVRTPSYSPKTLKPSYRAVSVPHGKPGTEKVSCACNIDEIYLTTGLCSFAGCSWAGQRGHAHRGDAAGAVAGSSSRAC